MLDRWVLQDTMNNAQSEEDGTMGIIMGCCSPDAKSGDFYGPEGRTGAAITLPPERDEAGEKLLWETSLETTGAEYPF